MKWFASFLAELMAKLLPWILSGKKETNVDHTDGLDGMDRNEVTGMNGLKPDDLPDI